MLIRFNVKNFMAFASRDDGNSEEFSMLAGRVRGKKDHIYSNGKVKVLKFAAIYGANASGKSSLVKALRFMRQVVVNKLPDGYSELYCKIKPENVALPTYFEVEVMIHQKIYAYGFEIVLSKGEIVSEWLVELGEKMEKTIFSRDVQNSQFILSPTLQKNKFASRLEIYADDITHNRSVLFLSVMNENKEKLYETSGAENISIFRDIFVWFQKDLDITGPNQPITDYHAISQTETIHEVCNILSAFGTGITNYKILDVSLEQATANMPSMVKLELLGRLEKIQVELRRRKQRGTASIVVRSNAEFYIITIENGGDGVIRCQTIEFAHGNDEVLFKLQEESDGTVRLLDLLEILLVNKDKVYVIDELDRCLHPSLTYHFVKNFLQLAAKRNVQLIVTTHESRLLDFDLLRRDEIWFIDKKIKGNANIYSLEEYNTRFDQKIDKAYLDGRYGGVPIFSTLFPLEGV